MCFRVGFTDTKLFSVPLAWNEEAELENRVDVCRARMTLPQSDFFRVVTITKLASIININMSKLVRIMNEMVR